MNCYVASMHIQGWMHYIDSDDSSYAIHLEEDDVGQKLCPLELCYMQFVLAITFLSKLWIGLFKHLKQLEQVWSTTYRGRNREKLLYLTKIDTFVHVTYFLIFLAIHDLYY